MCPSPFASYSLQPRSNVIYCAVHMRRAMGNVYTRASREKGSRAASVVATQATGRKELFYVAATERGQERNDLPLWALRPNIPAEKAFLCTGVSERSVERRDVPEVAGCFQLLNLLSDEECFAFTETLGDLGFHSDAAVSLPFSVRHMVNCNLVVPEAVDFGIFDRCRDLLPHIGGCEPLGINAKFRCYRYGPGDYFKPHTDGAWPGSRALNHGGVEMDAYGDRLSQLTFLILLTDDYEGGETNFLHPGSSRGTKVRTPKGAALCFPHGHHPDSPLHEGMLVKSGTKTMIRTEVLYSLKALSRLSHL